MTAKHSKDEEQRRDCLMCGRDCLIICERGGLTIKEPCPNKCSAGYMKPKKVDHARDRS